MGTAAERKRMKGGHMALGNRAVRRSCNSERTQPRPGRTRESIAREYRVWTHIAGIIIGIAFGLLFALAIVSG